MNIFTQKYDCIFSLGADCSVAESLSKSKLRYFSSPFDWLLAGSFKDRISFLLNDFDSFLDKDCLEKIGSKDEPERTDIYLNKKTNISFMHDFPKDVPLTESYDYVKNKYNRRINNLIRKISNSKRTLIVYGDLYAEKQDVDFENIKDLAINLNDKFCKNTIDILFICVNKDIKFNDFLLNEYSDNLYVAELSNCIDNDTPKYQYYMHLFSKIRKKIQLKDIALKIAKTPSRTRIYLFGVKILSLKSNNFSY